METFGTRRLPEDLFLYLAKLCLPSELSLLVLLSKSYYHTLVTSLYQETVLTRVRAVLSFCDTISSGRVLLRTYPKVIRIDLNGVSDEELQVVGHPIRAMLSVVPNLQDLNLLLPKRVILDIFEPGLEHTFMLTRLDIRIIAGCGFSEFLKHQTHVKDFVGRYQPPLDLLQMLPGQISDLAPKLYRSWRASMAIIVLSVM